MIRQWQFLSAAALCLIMVGCGDDAKPTPPAPTGTVSAKPTAAATAKATATAATTAVVAANDDDIPAEVDFEDEAEKDITADNLEAEIGKMEKELDAP